MKRREIAPVRPRIADTGLPGTVVSCTPVILGKKALVPVLRSRKRGARSTDR